MKVPFGVGWRDGIKNSCETRDSRGLYLTLDFVFQLGPETTYVRWKEQAVQVNEEKKPKQNMVTGVFFNFYRETLINKFKLIIISQHTKTDLVSLAAVVLFALIVH